MKTTIKKAELKKIHAVACKDWKTTIENYAKRNPFEDEVTFEKAEITKMINACSPEQLLVVREVFEIQDTTSQIDSLESACNYLGESDDDVKQLRILENVKGLARYIIAEQELVVITKAINEKEELDWDDHGVTKYYNWWYLGSNSRLSTVDYYCSCSNCSARLCYTSREKAQYSADKFRSIWKDYLNK